MRLSIKGLAFAVAIAWGGCFFLVALAHLVWPGYARSFLELCASVYPGYKLEGGFGEVVIGTLYALLDGLLCGAVLAWLYNLMARPVASQA